MALVEEVRRGTRGQTRAAIIDVAATLLGTGGSGAVTTRAVAAAAGVQAPAIYRLFGDKAGLLDAVAEYLFAAYVETKVHAVRSEDPVADLDEGWQFHVGFGLANPALFALLADPERAARLANDLSGREILAQRVHRVFLAGRLAVPERRAIEMIRAAGTGVVLTLLTVPPADRDPGLVAAVYAAVKRAIVTDPPAVPLTGAAVAAIALRAGLPDIAVLSAAERSLLSEWLDRIGTTTDAQTTPTHTRR